MTAHENRQLGRNLLRPAREIVAKFQHQHDLTTIPIPRVPKVQSFGNDWDMQEWLGLLRFERLIRAARERNVEAYWEMQGKMQGIERMLVEFGEPLS